MGEGFVFTCKFRDLTFQFMVFRGWQKSVLGQILQIFLFTRGVLRITEIHAVVSWPLSHFRFSFQILHKTILSCKISKYLSAILCLLLLFLILRFFYPSLRCFSPVRPSSDLVVKQGDILIPLFNSVMFV